ncbi:RNase H domain-containing protein [Trichonephila clavipes]|nr:RNase H domain-containing protein [Trichonephila clavipes]
MGRLHRDGKKAIVVPIRKPGKDIASAGSFRPIVFISITYNVLFEADLQPIRLRRNAYLVKYYKMLSGLGFQNRTSKFLRSWSSHQRLKRGSPFGQAVSGHLVASSIEHRILSQIIVPSESLDRVYFHFDLSIHASKQKELSFYVKHLALE